MKYLLVCFFSLILFCSCHDTGTTKSVPVDRAPSLPALKIDNEAWGGDFTIHIDQIKPLSEGKTLYTLLSSYSGKPVGFYLILREPPGKPEFVGNGVVLKPMGDTSNNFLEALSQIYGMKHSNLIFADSVIATYINLGNMSDVKKPGNWAAAQMKLFFGDGSAELYMNIDQNAGIISFPEKDSANRARLMDAFSKSAKR